MNKIYIILDNVKYAQNIGPIFRIADAFGIEKIFLCKGNTQKLNPNHERILFKASRGATNWVNWEFKNSSIDLVKELKGSGVHVVCIETGKDSTPIYKAEYSYPLALVFGSEDDGVCQEILDMADSIVKIPMLGRGRSMNISTTVGIAVYDACRPM